MPWRQPQIISGAGREARAPHRRLACCPCFAGVRVMEVREAYSAEDFDWKECKELASKGIQEANVRLLRQYATEKFAGALANQSPPS